MDMIIDKIMDMGNLISKEFADIFNIRSQCCIKTIKSTPFLTRFVNFDTFQHIFHVTLGVIICAKVFMSSKCCLKRVKQCSFGTDTRKTRHSALTTRGVLNCQGCERVKRTRCSCMTEYRFNEAWWRHQLVSRAHYADRDRLLMQNRKYEICYFYWICKTMLLLMVGGAIPDSKVHGAYMGPTWILSAPVGPTWGWPHEPCYQGCFCIRPQSLST